jgi:hypothetical protein
MTDLTLNSLFHVGTYQLGYRYVDLYLEPDSLGGSFQLNSGDPAKQRHATMTLGADHDCMSDLMEVAAHETFEAACQELGCRFKPCTVYVANASDVYYFHLDHNQMSEITARVGNFLWQIGPDLQAAIHLLKGK